MFTSLWYETFGLAVAEAKSYGIPCVVPDECAASEQVENSKTGYIFKTGDLDSLKSTLQKYESSNIGELQNNLVNDFSVNTYSISNHIDSLITIYNKIFNRNE